MLKNVLKTLFKHLKVFFLLKIVTYDH